MSAPTPPAPAAAAFARRAMVALTCTVLIALLACAAAVAAWTLTRPSEPLTDVEVHDTAGVLDPERVRADLAGVRGYAPLRVVVFTRTGQPIDNINAKTLDWAREHPDSGLLSADGDDWADGLLLITVSVESGDSSPGSGQVGTYFGPDVAFGDSEEESVRTREKRLQEAGYDLFRERNWTGGAVAIAEAAAGSLQKPWFASTWVIGLGLGGVLLICVLNGMTIQGSRRRFTGAARRFDEVSEPVHDRATAVEFIDDAGFGATIRSSAADLLRTYDDARAERDAIAGTAPPAISLLNTRLGKRIIAFERTPATIAAATEMLRRASAVYGSEPGWESLWAEEIADTRRHLDALTGGVSPSADSATAAELEAWGTRAVDRLEEIDARGRAGEIDAALTDLASLRAELSERMERLEAASAAGEDERSGFVRDGIAHERALARRAMPTSITGFADRRSFYAPTAFALGAVRGLRTYDRQQRQRAEAARSSSSTTGYGSTGGGFRGAGSSSRF